MATLKRHGAEIGRACGPDGVLVALMQDGALLHRTANGWRLLTRFKVGPALRDARALVRLVSRGTAHVKQSKTEWEVNMIAKYCDPIN